MQKKVLAINDISCVGRCALTVAQPIISATGLECSVLPTALLSTHPAGFNDFCSFDLSEQINEITNNFEKNQIKFSGVYSGFLGSSTQIETVKRLVTNSKENDGIFLLDPVMADAGKLYKIISPDMLDKMKKLCEIADIIVPNLSEAVFLSNSEYIESNYTEEYLQEISRKLVKLGAKNIVITGISLKQNEIGAYYYNSEKNDFKYIFEKKINGSFHGTGDIFSSVLISCLVKKISLEKSIEIACKYINFCIEETVCLGLESRFGLAFERKLLDLMNLIGDR